MCRFLAILLVIVLGGCVSSPPTRTPNAGKYDNDHDARKVYMKGFADGWQDGWAGVTLEMLPRDMNQQFTNALLKAADLDGFNDGFRAGAEDLRHFALEYRDRASQ